MLKKTSSPLWKSIVFLKNQLVEIYRGHQQVIDLMTGWEQKGGGFTFNAYSTLRPQSSTVNWEKIVWEQWALPKHNFILWLAIHGKLCTKDRLKFTHTDTLCMFCRQAEESHGHLFFSCNWTFSL